MKSHFQFRRGKFNVILDSTIQVAFLFIISFALVDYWKERGLGALLIAVLISIGLIYTIYLNLAKIKIDNNGIIYSSINRKGFLDWDSINYFGIRSYSGRSYSNISLAKADKWTFGRKLICISKHDKSVSLASQKLGVDYITFGYNKEILEFMKTKISSL
tara:strand:- start:286 stop:765 length:480 start_codon:yes stop_codon:yes gene_type:complete